MMTYRVWLRDEFTESGDDDERNDLAYEVRCDRDVWRTDKLSGQHVIVHPYPIDDAGYAAKVYASWYHSNSAGWECSWPIEFVVHDGERYSVVEVTRDYDPVFSASKPKPLESAR